MKKALAIILLAVTLVATGCSSQDWRETWDVIDAILTPIVQVDAKCRALEEMAQGTFCDGQLCEPNSGSCTESGCICTVQQ